MSGLQSRNEDSINGVDVREQGSALRVATNTPHLVSLGTGRLSTAVTLHPIKQGRVTIGSDPTCDLYVLGPGVCPVHCRIENSLGVLTLYPVNGTTLIDQMQVDTPTRLEQGCMITIGRSNYLRYNNPEEAKLMKSVLPNQTNTDYFNQDPNNQCYQNPNRYKDSLSQLDKELDMTLRDLSRRKPPVAPRKPYRDLDLSDVDSDQESKPKLNSIMAKVSKFEYYAKQQKTVGRSQFYTSENEISPKVFSSNSLTVNTPAKDVLGGRSMPHYMNKNEAKLVVLNENNCIEAKKCSYTNVAIRNKNKIEDIVRNFDDNSRFDNTQKLKKVNNDQVKTCKNNIEKTQDEKCNLDCKNNIEFSKCIEEQNNDLYGKIGNTKLGLPSPAFDRNPQYSPAFGNTYYDRGVDAECMRKKAYQDRVKEQEQREAETARLEEILNMCAEYEKQINSGIPITPTEKRAHNKIITNGSLPRSTALNNPNFVQTSEGYYKFETSQNRNQSIAKSLPVQRNVSSYENFDTTHSPNSYTEQLTPEVSIGHHHYENVGRMDEIGIPVFEDSRTDLSSPILIRKVHNQSSEPKSPLNIASSPIGSPYENVLARNNYMNFKPKSPNTQSPRSRIKTTFAHKNLPSPQYFIFPTPPPVDSKPNFDVYAKSNEQNSISQDTNSRSPNFDLNINKTKDENTKTDQKFGGIEKQLSLEEEIPMIDDSDITNDVEQRHSTIITEKQVEEYTDKINIDITNQINNVTNKNKIPPLDPEIKIKNQSFEDVKNELMADIPELDEFEKDLKRDKFIKHINDDLKRMDIEADSIDSVIDDNLVELKVKYDALKEERRKLMGEIHELKCKMSQIRLHEDDVLRELEMEKALIKGEYDSEIAILNLEQKKRTELSDKIKSVEEEVRQLKRKQEARQTEMKDRVDIATVKVERLEKDIHDKVATLEELQNAQDILDNETKLYEDLEFQHLEEESELLSNKEDLHNELTLLTKKIDAQKQRILTLKSEANSNLTSALDETKILQAEYVRLLNQVEDLTTKVQAIEKELKPVINKLNDIERTQSPDSAFYTDQTRAKSGEFGYSPQSSDSDDLDLTKISNYEDHNQHMKDKFNSIDQMSQSMIVDIERRIITDIDTEDQFNESPTKSSTSKEKKGFWERNFDSLKRKSKDKKPKSPEKVDIMSQSLNENLFYNNENIENDVSLDRFNSLRHSKKKEKDKNSPAKSNSSSKIPTFSALGKIIKKDSFKKRSSKENQEINENKEESKTRYIKHSKSNAETNKYMKAKSLSPEKLKADETIHEITEDGERSPKIKHRKSLGDEPLQNSVSELNKISDTNKVPSQDDIDRISKVTMDAPIFSSDTDMNTLGKKTFDSLMEIERKRMEMLEVQGCQVIENEREKISELKRRVQDETKKLWDQKNRSELSKSIDSDVLDVSCQSDSVNERKEPGRRIAEGDDYNVTNSSLFDESSGLMSASSIEELQVRNSRTESTEDEKRSNDSRPLSHASDFSRDNILQFPEPTSRVRRSVAPYSPWQRPLTRYLPVDRDDFDLRRHVETAGHQVELCPHVTVTPTSCRGYLHKLGAKFHTWSKRWFVFDRESKTFVYYWDKSEKKPRGGAYFQVIEEVYLDHGNTSKSPNPLTTFIVKTRQRRYFLMAPSGEAARIWIDVIFTGAQGYTEYLE